MSDKLVFSRAQLQAVFKDFNTVKEFERLVAQINAHELLIAPGATGSFTADGHTLTIVNGIITAIV